MAYGAILGQQPPQQLDAQNVSYSGAATGSNVKEALDGLKNIDDGLEAAVQALTSTVSGKAQIVTGSYVGTGTYGSSSPNVINTPFPAKVLIVSGEMANATTGTTVAVRSVPLVQGSAYQSGWSVIYISWSDENISYYGHSSGEQMNYSGQTYFYAILG